MKTKLKRCLATMIIIVTCFCILDNNFVVSKFFANLIMPNAYAEPMVPGEEPPSTGSTSTTFVDKMVEIALGIGDDTWDSPDFDVVHAPYTYLWGGDGELHGSSPTTGKDGINYATFDCRGFVAGVIRYASRAYETESGTTMPDDLKNMVIYGTDNEYKNLVTDTGGKFGCSKINNVADLKSGDILYRGGHTEIFIRGDDGSARQVGAHRTSCVMKKADGEYGPDDVSPEDALSETNYWPGEWECYFRYGGPNTYMPTGTGTSEDGIVGNLGPGRNYTGEYDEKAELDEQVFDFQGNPQVMVFEGETNLSAWLFTLLAQFLDFISGLLVSLLINPIMQMLNAIVNFLTNFINQISGLPTGT